MSFAIELYQVALIIHISFCDLIAIYCLCAFEGVTHKVTNIVINYVKC